MFLCRTACIYTLYYFHRFPVCALASCCHLHKLIFTQITRVLVMTQIRQFTWNSWNPLVKMSDLSHSTLRFVSLYHLARQMKRTSKLGKYLRSYSCLVYFAFRSERPEHRRRCVAKWTWERLQQLWETIWSAIPHTSTGNKRVIYDDRRGRGTRRHKQTGPGTKN